MAKFNKHYSSIQEFQSRKALFEETSAHVKAANSNPNYTFFSKVNKFADLTEEEMQ